MGPLLSGFELDPLCWNSAAASNEKKRSVVSEKCIDGDCLIGTDCPIDQIAEYTVQCLVDAVELLFLPFQARVFAKARRIREHYRFAYIPQFL
jgi:hypothetical protein